MKYHQKHSKHSFKQLLENQSKANQNKLHQPTKFKLAKHIVKQVWVTNTNMFQKNAKQSINHAFKKQS